MKTCFILLSHFVVVKHFGFFFKYKLSSRCDIKSAVPQSFLSDILCFEWAKESLNKAKRETESFVYRLKIKQLFTC